MQKTSLLLVAVFLLCCLCTEVFAHPGRTDANGGHTDHSTGKYHYHHGYSAHQHYDMDGDGIADCPYDFKDKTGQSSGSSSTLEKAKTASYSSTTVKDEDEMIHISFGGFIIAIVFVLICIWVIVSEKNNQLEQERYKFRDELSKKENECKKRIEEIQIETSEILYIERAKLQNMEREVNERIKKAEKIEEEARKQKIEAANLISVLKDININKVNMDAVLSIAGAPRGSIIDSNGKPSSDEYWFYYRDIEYGIRRLHRANCVHSARCNRVNVVDVLHQLDKYTFCQHCRPTFQNVEWAIIAHYYLTFMQIASEKQKRLTESLLEVETIDA